jgi:hypothetical protein
MWQPLLAGCTIPKFELRGGANGTAQQEEEATEEPSDKEAASISPPEKLLHFRFYGQAPTSNTAYGQLNMFVGKPYTEIIKTLYQYSLNNSNASYGSATDMTIMAVNWLLGMYAIGRVHVGAVFHGFYFEWTQSYNQPILKYKLGLPPYIIREDEYYLVFYIPYDELYPLWWLDCVSASLWLSMNAFNLTRYLPDIPFLPPQFITPSKSYVEYNPRQVYSVPQGPKTGGETLTVIILPHALPAGAHPRPDDPPLLRGNTIYGVNITAQQWALSMRYPTVTDEHRQLAEIYGEYNEMTDYTQALSTEAQQELERKNATRYEEAMDVKRAQEEEASKTQFDE